MNLDMLYMMLVAVMLVGTGCHLEDPEARKQREKEEWEGPCREMVISKDRVIVVTCTNKNHRIVIEGDWVLCKCPVREKE